MCFRYIIVCRYEQENEGCTSGTGFKSRQDRKLGRCGKEKEEEKKERVVILLTFIHKKRICRIRTQCTLSHTIEEQFDLDMLPSCNISPLSLRIRNRSP